MQLQGTKIPCLFHAAVKVCLPIRLSEQTNRKIATARRNKKGSGNIMILNLIKPKNIPSIGKHLATFLDITHESGKSEDGSEFNRLVVTTELEATDKEGRKFTLVKTYNLDGRGLTAFREDYRSWSSRKLTDKDLESFDAENMMKGQPLAVLVKHRKDGKDTIAVIDAFLPVPPPAAVS